MHKAHTHIHKYKGLRFEKKVAVFKRLTTMMSEREREKKYIIYAIRGRGRDIKVM